MNNILEILNAHRVEPIDYKLRPTVKIVILNKDNEVLLLNNSLVGGGVEEGESIEDAITRECLEEVGAIVQVEQSLGSVIQYRDFIKKKYEVFGFIAHIISLQSRTTTQEDELATISQWKPMREAISFLEQRIKNLEEKIGTKSLSGEQLQAMMYNAKTHLVFLKKAQELIR